MAEIKEKIASVSGGVEITTSSDMYVRGVLSEWESLVNGTNGVVVNVGTDPVTKSTALVESTFNTQSPTSNKAPVAFNFTRVESFRDNPSGLGHVLRFERIRARKRHRAQMSKAA